MWYPLAAMKGVLEALHQGDYDTAIDLLTRKALFGREREAKEAWLLLAEVYALYGEEGLEKAHHALEEAYALGGLEYDPLYRSLLAELLALEGRPEREVLPLFLPSRDPRVRYHQAQALFYLGRLEEALEALEAGLPPHLAWRAEGLKGRILERLGRHGEAALAYERGAELALGLERYWLLLDAAAMWLEAGEGERALLALKEAEAAVGEEAPEDAATRHYLLARAHLLLGNPGLALEEIRKALALEEESGHKAYGTPLVEGQALLQLGRYEEAMASFREALARADAGERPHVLHEMGVAALDHGAYPEAEEHLRALVREEGYPYLAQAYADLAEALYRLGYVERAGSGVDKMYRLLLKYGKEPPEYRLFPEALTLVLYNPELDEAFVREIAEAQERLGGFSLDHLIAVGYLRRVGEAGLEELARALQLPEEAARRVLSRMERMGLLRKEGGRYHLARRDLLAERALALLEAPRRRQEVERVLGLSRKRALELLRRLIREGRVERVGRGAATRYRRR